jgi:hypothetical protein
LHSIFVIFALNWFKSYEVVEYIRGLRHQHYIFVIFALNWFKSHEVVEYIRSIWAISILFL